MIVQPILPCADDVANYTTTPPGGRLPGERQALSLVPLTLALAGR